jgi:hypothetical protein
MLGYVVGGVAGGFLVYLLSSNTHGLSVEAPMTGAFVTYPLVAFLAFIVGFIQAKPSPTIETRR